MCSTVYTVPVRCRQQCGASAICCPNMCVRTPAVLLLLLLMQIWLSAADRQNDKRTSNQDVRTRRHDTEERHSGRRWTTSRNSPYQKIVSSYEAEPEARTAGEEEGSQGEDQAKAKHKRKQWRTSASAHDQITSETSSNRENGSEEEKSNDQEEGHPGVQRTQRRRSTTSHPPEVTTDSPTTTTINPKKRRRPSSTTTTTTLAPQTMSDSLYQYFRPLEQDVPQDDIIPFLDFGRKLSPVIPTPSGVNSIENRSSVTKLRPREHHEEKESNSSDEEILQEDMDVTVVKKAIERNSVPRGKLRVQSSGISDYYRKRVPAQVRTTENLISTSDSSTAASVSSGKNIGLLKKINRHHVHRVEPSRIEEKVPLKHASELESLSIPKDVEFLQDNRKAIISRPGQRSAALKEETHTSPLTAESTLVKTVIKEVPEDISSESETAHITTTVPNMIIHNLTKAAENQNTMSSQQTEIVSNNSATPANTKGPVDRQEKTNPKILSTAVVTSVSVQEPLKDSKNENITELTNSNSETLNNTKDTQPTTVFVQENKSTYLQEKQVRNYISNKNSSNYVPANQTLHHHKPSIAAEHKNSTARNSTAPTISRDIYRQRNPPRIPIHLPRQLARINSTQVKSTPTATSTTVTTTESSSPELSVSSITNDSSSTASPASTTEKVVVSTAILSSTTVGQTTPSIQKVTSESPKQTTPPVSSLADLNPKHEEIKNFTSAPPYKVIPIVLSNTTESTNEKEQIINVSEVTTEEEKKDIFTENTPEDHEDKLNKNEEHIYEEESEPVSPPSEESEVMSFVPIPSEEESEDQFPNFTTSPPVVDIRPDTENAVVEEQRNASTTSRPVEVTDWVKTSEVNKEVEVVYPEAMGLGTYLLAALGVVPVILGALIGARFILAHNRKKVLDESEYSSEYNRSPLSGSTSSPLPTKLPRIPTHVNWSEREPEKTPLPATPAPTPSSRWEFPREKLRLQTLLGQGNFGQVWKAEADDIAGHEGLTRLVAVKTVKESANTREREDLLRELGIMQELGSHPNVVTLLGCCTEKEPIYLVMEYVMYGKLLSFLRDHRTRAHYYNFSDATDALTSRDLTVFGYCVARGMDYLSNKSIIHRDMAARNVLVDHNKLCKIADFGMSRNVRDTGQIYEQRQSKGALPIRWMAPESLHFSLFTHKTDVWSFGILMWEIVTLGSTPYATMGAREVMRRVRDGYRLERPSHCRPELFRVISRCWHSEPSKRPTFAELKVELGALLSDPELHGSFVDLDSFADEMRRDTLHRHH